MPNPDSAAAQLLFPMFANLRGRSVLLVGGGVLISLYFLRWRPAMPPEPQNPATDD